MTIEQARAVVEERPHLHVSRDGSTKDGGLNRRMGSSSSGRSRTLDRPRIAETGTGLTTLLFLSLEPDVVISVSPAPELHDRTRVEARRRDIDLSPVRFVDDRSENALPLLALVEEVELDVGFIDGNHGWPAVFVDFCYLNRMLRPGGLMFIDDVQIYAVAQLVCLLRVQQPHYELVDAGPKMATFRKVLDLPYLPDWRMEPFITGNTATA